jgi:hypothetical protein
MSNVRRRKPKARRRGGVSFHVPGVYAALGERWREFEYIAEPVDAGAPVVVQAWQLSAEAQSAIWRRPITEYGFVRSPSLDAMYEDVRVDADDTITLVADDEDES